MINVSQLEMLRKRFVIEIKIVERVQITIDKDAKIFHARSTEITTNEKNI